MHHVTSNGFENNIIICWYIIFYELFVWNFKIKMYNVIENKFIVLKKSFIGTKYEKDYDDFL
jgi:hypothetical protein